MKAGFKRTIIHFVFLCVRVAGWCKRTIFATAEDVFGSDYPYFSSTSSSFVQHAAEYCEMAKREFCLNDNSFVVEVASNDGYLLQNFVEANVPCLGVEPTASTAQVAVSKGIPVVQKFFGEETAKALIKSNSFADLIIGNNVYAHVPDIRDFTVGIEILLAQEGVVTLEFPHVLNLIDQNQFDTVYHEHFSYLSLTAVANVFSECGLKIFKVEEIPTHGGSLRIYGSKSGRKIEIDESVNELLEIEKEKGYKFVLILCWCATEGGRCQIPSTEFFNRS